jgi:hypothetical protein
VLVARKFPNLLGSAVDTFGCDARLPLCRSAVSILSKALINKWGEVELGLLALAGTFLSVANLIKRPVDGGERHCLHLSVAAILTSERFDTPRQASTGMLLHYENLFGLYRCRESFLD